MGCSDTTSADCKDVVVQNVFIHPCYTASTTQVPLPSPRERASLPPNNTRVLSFSLWQDHDDIALMQLYMEVPEPAGGFALIDGIHRDAVLEDGATLTLAGFGLSDPASSEPSTLLLRVDVPLRSRVRSSSAVKRIRAGRGRWTREQRRV